MGSKSHIFLARLDINSKVAYFFIREAGKKVSENGKYVRSLPPYWRHTQACILRMPVKKAPVEHYTHADSKQFGARGISVTIQYRI
jgi:hypothetical protein